MLPTYNYQPLSIPPVSFLGKGWIPLFQALGVLNDYALYKSTHSLTHSKLTIPKERLANCVLKIVFLVPGNELYQYIICRRHPASGPCSGCTT